MRYFLVSLLFVMGCNKLPNTNTIPPSPDFIFKGSGMIQGTTETDWDQIHDVSFTSKTDFQVQVNGVMLNKYEFSVDRNQFIFGKIVTILPNGSITYAQPPVPVAPKGSSYIIQWTN